MQSFYYWSGVIVRRSLSCQVLLGGKRQYFHSFLKSVNSSSAASALVQSNFLKIITFNESGRVKSQRTRKMATITDILEDVRANSKTNCQNGNDSVDSSYILIDIGANLTNKKFSRDVDAVVQRAKECGVQKIMVTGTNILVSKEALRLTRLFPDTLFSTAGIHPHDAKTFDETSESEIEALLANPECVAVGECGLDFNRNFSPPETQLEVFEKQVALACRLRKPLFLHERDAHDEMMNILKKYQSSLPPSVLHCFTGNIAQAKAYLDLGLYIGITGYIWKDKSDDGVRKMLSDNIIPLDRLLVETDAPFMYPNTRSAKLSAEVKQIITQRSMTFLNRYCTFQRNEPCSLPCTMELIAALMGKPPEDVALATTYNALKLFGLSS